MENEKNITWEDALKDQKDFLIFEENEKTSVALTNWTLTEEEVRKYKSEEMEIKPVLRADVIGLNGKACEKQLRTSSVRLFKALSNFLDLEKNQEVVFVSIVKIGKESATNYFVEKREPFNIKPIETESKA